ncbi:Copper oxidase [Pseudomonas sp. IT-P218]|jgi:hypothetical protein
MSERVLNNSAISRRGLIRAFALLSLGGLVVKFSGFGARSPAGKSEFVVINGWVLPAAHFR